MKKLIMILSVCILALSLSACGKSAKEKVQGKWEHKESGEKIYLKIKDDKAELKHMGITLVTGKVKETKKKDTLEISDGDAKSKVKIIDEEHIKVDGDKFERTKDRDDE